MSVADRRPILAFTLVAGLGLAGCAGGGGGGSSAPPVTPAPTPTPTPTPVSLVVNDATQGYQIFASGGVTVSAAAQGGGSPVKVTVTDESGKWTRDNLNHQDTQQFDGHQSIKVDDAPDGGGVTLASADFRATPTADPRSGLSSGARTLPLTTWESTGIVTLTGQTGVTGGFYIYGLEKGLPGSLSALSYVSLAEWQGQSTSNNGAPPWRGGFVLIGDQSALADMPKTGTAVFNGEAFGRLGSSGGFGSPFLGSVTMNVDFSKTTGAITGSIDNSLQSKPGDALRLAINFSADINPHGPSFSGTATAANANGGTALTAPMTGTVAGAFFGPTARPASEAGGVFSLGITPTQVAYASSQTLSGGFVAGR